MKNFTHIIHSDYSRKVNDHDIEWFKYRLKILENFTLKSLANQTEKDFYYIMYLRKCFPDELVPELQRMLNASGLRNEIIYYDIEDDIKNKISELFPKRKYIYATRIDSDDLFHKDTVKEIQSHSFEWRTALIYQRGYCYNCIDKKMRYHTMSCPPFLTIMYPHETYLDLDSINEYKTTSGGHDTVISGMNSIILSKDKYIVLFHDGNNRSRYTEPIKPGFEVIPRERHSEILKDFNIDEEVWKKLKI